MQHLSVCFVLVPNISTAFLLTVYRKKMQKEDSLPRIYDKSPGSKDYQHSINNSMNANDSGNYATRKVTWNKCKQRCAHVLCNLLLYCSFLPVKRR